MKYIIHSHSMFYGADSNTFEIARLMRSQMTLPEIIIWKKLKDRKIFKAKFRRQHPVNIFIVDFYCHEFKLAIEIDGGIHNDKEIKERDLSRTAELEKFGITLIRFTNDEIFCDLDGVIKKILMHTSS